MGQERELKMIFDSFDRLFDGRVLSFSTSFVQLTDCYIHFKNEQLFHLLGLHNIYKGPEAKIRRQILSGKITLKKIKRNENYGLIKERISNINFLREVFIDHPFETCILVSKYDNHNRMNLDLVFSSERNSRKIILGLRRSAYEYFVPVTLFVTKNKAFDYKHSKRVKINSMFFIN